ncbi:RND family efflux transporter, MFP subunit [Sphingobium faniae]|nr:RND family efflux transporter, MFP subunit [Sphingobium faniae]
MIESDVGVETIIRKCALPADLIVGADDRRLVDQYGGAVRTNDGRIAAARLQLEYARVRAPITGHIGLREVDAGNLVRGGDTIQIAIITQMQPISAIFTIPEIQIDEVRQAMRGDGALTVEAWDRGERTLLATGRLTTVDNRIHAGSGTLRLRGEFANGDERLFPNQFVNVRLRVRTIKDAVTVPASAIQYGAQGSFLYVIDKAGLARRRDLTIGACDGTRTQILRGVAAGERAVLQGLDRLKEGQKVEIVAMPRAEGASTPAAPAR